MDRQTIERKLQQSQGDADDAKVLAEVRAERDAPRILEELAKSTDLEVRGWVPNAAREILGRDAIPLIQRLTRDPDPDIRDIAVGALEALSPGLLNSLAPSLRERLRSTHDSEVLSTAWRLAQARDFEAVPLIETFRDRFDPSWWQYKAASVVLLTMQSPDDVPRLIRDHDHDRMTWLSYAASWLDDPEARIALEECAGSAPDEQCRSMCRYSLDHP